MLCQESIRILRFHGHHKAAVGKGGIAAGKRHAIHHHFIILCGGGHNKTTRAHAERVHTAVLNLGGQGIAGSRQPLRALLTGAQVVLRGINEALRVLNTHTHSKGLALQAHTFIMQHAVHISGAVASGQNDGIAGEFTAICRAHAQQALAIGALQQAIHAGLEMHLATGGNDAAAHGLDDIRQAVGADVRVRIGQNLRGSTVGHKGFVNLHDRPTLRGAGE